MCILVLYVQLHIENRVHKHMQYILIHDIFISLYMSHYMETIFQEVRHPLKRESF